MEGVALTLGQDGGCSPRPFIGKLSTLCHTTKQECNFLSHSLIKKDKYYPEQNRDVLIMIIYHPFHSYEKFRGRESIFFMLIKESHYRKH